MLNASLHIDSILNAGSDETVVFIEGIGANLKGWDLFVDSFVTHNYNIVRYDHPCAGRSFLNSGCVLSANDFIESLELVLSQIEGKIHLVGYSLGGMVIFRWLCDMTDSANYNKIKSITIGAGFVSLYGDLVAGFGAAKNTLLCEDAKSSHIKSLSFLYDAESLKNKSFHDYLVNRCLDDDDFITSHNFISQIDACLASKEWRKPPAVSNNCQIPLLLMYAKDDKIINSQYTILVEKYFSNVTLYEFPYGGHCFKDVHRDKFIQLITDHISKTGPKEH